MGRRTEIGYINTVEYVTDGRLNPKGTVKPFNDLSAEEREELLIVTQDRFMASQGFYRVEQEPSSKQTAI